VSVRGELVREAEAGRLSLVARHGKPMDEQLLKECVAVALAVQIFAGKTISLGKAARLACPLRNLSSTLARGEFRPSIIRPRSLRRIGSDRREPIMKLIVSDASSRQS